MVLLLPEGPEAVSQVDLPDGSGGCCALQEKRQQPVLRQVGHSFWAKVWPALTLLSLQSTVAALLSCHGLSGG